ncbi:phosphoenolpyruvate--protein phosphotransferase [Effusibacillus consociatus]|uniref:Phosphoenolpyruvate-protein phosphotransferase n=1 Tax=Effusibacillus consociatus TaxID=1117041 RepID=A0ABV9Q1X9_9BACL
MSEIKFVGIGVSEGIRIGKALLYTPYSSKVESFKEYVTKEESKAEQERLAIAKEKSRQELNGLIERTKKTLGEEKAVILAGQQSMLEDPTFYPEIEKLVVNQQYSAEKAVTQIVEQISAVFESMDSEYLRERAADVRDLGGRLLSNLRDEKGLQLSEIREEVILVADDLTPSDTVQLDKQFILGFVTRKGGKTSHTAILARSLGIPAIVGVAENLDHILNEQQIIIDGTTGECIVDPDAGTIEQYRKKMGLEQEQKELLQEFALKPAVTQDGFQVEIAANIGTPKEAVTALEEGAEGIGLYRTEFLFMNATAIPDEEEQYQAYKEVAVTMGERPVVIRTLDIGGDKDLPYLSLPEEMNPFLGYRAIRLCLDQLPILKTQLRAILRASVHGNLKVMFPMISNLQEWRQAKSIFDEVREELEREGVSFDSSIEVGIMIEVPSAALLADRFAKEVDFFSIGTNDLVQYTVAVDRMNEKVAHLYDYFHPSVIRLIKTVIEEAHKEGKWVGMCGGMAGDPLAAPLLIGLGLDEWSMDAGSVNKIKREISRLNREDCRKLTTHMLELDTNEEIREELKKILQN